MLGVIFLFLICASTRDLDLRRERDTKMNGSWIGG
jgi:hypothetical protein